MNEGYVKAIAEFFDVANSKKQKLDNILKNEQFNYLCKDATCKKNTPYTSAEAYTCEQLRCIIKQFKQFISDRETKVAKIRDKITGGGSDLKKIEDLTYEIQLFQVSTIESQIQRTIERELKNKQIEAKSNKTNLEELDRIIILKRQIRRRLGEYNEDASIEELQDILNNLSYKYVIQNIIYVIVILILAIIIIWMLSKIINKNKV